MNPGRLVKGTSTGTYGQIVFTNKEMKITEENTETDLKSTLNDDSNVLDNSILSEKEKLSLLADYAVDVSIKQPQQPPTSATPKVELDPKPTTTPKTETTTTTNKKRVQITFHKI
jgi:hypothetical protein